MMYLFRKLPTRLLGHMENVPPAPSYELRIKKDISGDMKLSVWQMPCPASPLLEKPLRMAALGPAKAAMIESVLRKKLRGQSITLPSPGTRRKIPLNEEFAINLTLFFRLISPLRNGKRMREIAIGMERMRHVEISYWLGMTLGANPRRTLSALRLLLTGSKPCI